ncbi:MAG: acetylornithine deacetylase [Pseudomonadota bacterium]
MTSQDILETLIAFDTTSRLSNLSLITWVEDYLANYGVTGRRVLSPEGDKANFYATIGTGSAGGVVLSGHSDVVPVDGQDWTTDPYTLTQRGDKLYGRGTCDMKGFIACALAAVPQMTSLKRPIHLALSYDEEVGCQGVAPMVAAIVEHLPPIEAVIVGEPTMMHLVTGHKGIGAFQTTVRGIPAHSSQTQLGVSAVMVAAELITQLMTIAEGLKARSDPDFEPPHTTLTVNTIHGGAAINILAEHCSFMWDVRAIPGDDAATLLAEFEQFCMAKATQYSHPISIATEVIANAPGLTPQDDNSAETLIRRLTGANNSGAAAFATEAGFFQGAGFDTVVFGPGDIAQAHQPDEFITLKQLAACDTFLGSLVKHLS